MANPIVLPDKFTPDTMAALVNSVPLPLTDVEIDASEVAQLTAPGLQTLISVARTTRAAGHSFKFSNMSEAFVADLTLLGLDPKAALEDAQ